MNLKKKVRVLIENSSLITLTEEAQRVPNLFVLLIITVILFMVVPTIFYLGLYVLFTNREVIDKIFIGKANFTSYINAAIFNNSRLILSFGILVFVLWIWIKCYEGRSLKSFGFKGDRAIFKYFRGLGVGVVMLAIIILLMIMLGVVELQAIGISNFNLISGSFLILLGWGVQGASEEIIFRGWQLPVLSRKYNPVVAIIVSSSFFGIIHIFNNNFTLIALINIILAGIFAAFYALQEGNLWGVCGWHSGWNWAQANLFGLEVSGTFLEQSAGVLFDFKTTGPKLITGGDFGVEGGILATIIFLAAIIAILNRVKLSKIE